VTSETTPVVHEIGAGAFLDPVPASDPDEDRRHHFASEAEFDAWLDAIPHAGDRPA
jgi:hypothetical protein